MKVLNRLSRLAPKGSDLFRCANCPETAPWSAILLNDEIWQNDPDCQTDAQLITPDYTAFHFA